MPAEIDHTTASRNMTVEYWETFLQNFKPCHFPTLHDELPTLSNDFHETTLDCEIKILAFQDFCSQQHATLGSVFRAAWAVIISYYAGVEEVSFGYSTGEGTLPESGELDRNFICRTSITTETVVHQAITVIKRNFDEALGNQEGHIEEIQKLLSSNNLLPFDSELHIQSVGGLDLDGCPISIQGLKLIDSSKYDILARVLIRDDGSIAVSVRARMSKFSASQTASLAHTLVKTMSESIKSHPKTIIGDLDIFTRHDYQQVMKWNQRQPVAVNSCFHQLFEEIARKTPDAPSICSWDRNFTYRELDDASTKLASYLVDLGVGPESLVLICFHKSSMAIVSMLAIFKAGGAFVAMDPSYPESRIRAIATATKSSIVVAEPTHTGLFKGIMENIISIDHNSIDELPLAPSEGDVRLQPCPSNTAYIVFTSGSTGAPKGIMVEHRGLSTAALSLAAPMRVTAKSRFLQFAAYTFDLSYGDIFVTLSQGGCICIPSEHERVNGLAAAMVRMNVNTACLIPSVARIFQPEDVPCLKTLLVGGEALLQEVLDLWVTKVDLVQMYGPSEATIWCTAQPLLRPGALASNIGRGLAALLWITNITSHERLSPIGCIGELLIEGPVLARGYLDARQTETSFVENPSWAEVSPGQRRRFYKTGDLVRYDPDGTVKFVGRKDTQIKFHGRRIELGEIEYHLSSHDLLRQSMVTLPSKGVYSRHLVAIVVLKSSSKSSTEGLSQLKLIADVSKEKTASEVARVKDFLSVKIPSYMLPQYWVAVQEIPSMISGKMNRVMAKSFVENLTETNIEEIVGGRKGHANQEFHDTVELRLRGIWARILDKDIKDISADASFFDLGGDSFSAMELVASCKSAGLVLTVQDVASTSTIRQMASRLKIPTQPRPDVLENSSVYKGLKFAPSWWVPSCTPVVNELEIGKLISP